MEAEDLEGVLPVIEGCKFKPYFYLQRFDDSTLSRFLLSKVKEAAARDDSEILLAVVDGRAVGFAVLRKLSWDSDFFGFGCAALEHLVAAGDYAESLDTKSILLGGVDEICRRWKIRNISARAALADLSTVHSMEKCGFTTAGVLSALFWENGQPIRRLKTLYGVRPFRQGDIEMLEATARGSMRWDRFHADSRFPKEKSDLLYAQLTRNLCLGKICDAVLVADRDDKPVGFVACKILHDDNAHLPLRLGFFRFMAVSQKAGIGAGVALHETALGWFCERADIVLGITQVQNIPNLKINLRYGHRYGASFLDLQKWFW